MENTSSRNKLSRRQAALSLLAGTAAAPVLAGQTATDANASPQNTSAPRRRESPPETPPFGQAIEFARNVQIAFNVLPPDKKGFLEYPNGTMRHFEVYADTDYEYAFNPVAPAYGGGGEVWRLLAPGMPRKHFFPRQPKAPRDGGAVNAAQICWRRDHDTLFVEAALPWSEIPDAKQKLDRGETIKFTFRVNNNSGPALELATGRSVSKQNALTFHDDWETHWSNELEFGFEK